MAAGRSAGAGRPQCLADPAFLGLAGKAVLEPYRRQPTMYSVAGWLPGSTSWPSARTVGEPGNRAWSAATLDRYGHLYPDSYATLRDRLDALHSSDQERDAEVISLPSKVARPQRGLTMQ
jgi:hypothetical protein